MRKSDHTFLSKAVRLEFSVLESANAVLFMLIAPIQGPKIKVRGSFIDVVVSTICAKQVYHTN